MNVCMRRVCVVHAFGVVMFMCCACVVHACTTHIQQIHNMTPKQIQTPTHTHTGTNTHTQHDTGTNTNTDTDITPTPTHTQHNIYSTRHQTHAQHDTETDTHPSKLHGSLELTY